MPEKGLRNPKNLKDPGEETTDTTVPEESTAKNNREKEFSHDED